MAGFSVTLLRLDDELTRCGTRPSTRRPCAGASDPSSPAAAAPAPSGAAAATLDSGRDSTSAEVTSRCSTCSNAGSACRPSGIHDQAAALTALDQAIGDGDHGINMDRGFTAIVAVARRRRPRRPTATGRVPRTTLRTAGRTLISTVGGASGPLYGTAFMRRGGGHRRRRAAPSAGDARARRTRGGDRRASSALGKATTGEKTMLDALIPAAATPARGARGAGADLTARHGGDGRCRRGRRRRPPIPLLATKGRASYLGERSVGHQDPGATSAALLLRALADAVGRPAEPDDDRGR